MLSVRLPVNSRPEVVFGKSKIYVDLRLHGASAPTPTLLKGQPCLGKLCEQPRVLRGLMEEATGLWEPRRDT